MKRVFTACLTPIRYRGNKLFDRRRVLYRTARHELSYFVYSDKVHHAGDDVEMSQTMRRLGVTFGESLDSKGLPRFYCEAPEAYLLGPIPRHLFEFDVIKPQKVNDSCGQGFVHTLIICQSALSKLGGQYHLLHGSASNVVRTGRSVNGNRPKLIPWRSETP
jgi:hypothetical protein